MKSLHLAAAAALATLGCAGEFEYVEPAPVAVSVAPPAPRYEAPLVCSGGTWVGGHWAWRGGWRWTVGHCTRPRAGYIWVAPRYDGGRYYRGHYRRGGGYVPPPAPAYR